MSLKTGILLTAALALGAVTSALAQSSNDTGYDSARTGAGTSDSYANNQGDTASRSTARSGRSGTAGKHGGGKDGGSGTMDGGG